MFIALALLSASLQTNELPPIPFEFRGVWVATVDNIDWPTKRTLTTEQQKRELVAILDQAQKMKLNAIIFQVRPSADALYPSRIEPWSEFLTNRQGKSPSPMWDPLQFAVDEAHKRGLELHCWFNPYRALHPAQRGPVAPNHISKTEPKIVKKYGPFLWMDPGEKDVQRRSYKVILDVVKRYDIDGVHIDDYFYPYQEKDAKKNVIDFPDAPSWQRYVGHKGKLSKGDWRRKNVDDFIEKLYKGIKKEKRWVKFGISPFGIYRPGIPAGIKAGVDQYADLYADALKWFQKGWCDYFTPQLYWPITQTPQAYPTLLKWWGSENLTGRHFWPGNYTSRTLPNEGNWQAQEIVDQVLMTQAFRGAGGNIHFSMKPFMTDANGIVEALREGPYSKSAFVPPSPWLSEGSPLPPAIKFIDVPDFPVPIIRWAPAKEAARWYLYNKARSGTGGPTWGQWEQTSNTEFALDPRADKNVCTVAVVAIDRAGNPSAPSYVYLSDPKG